MQARAADVVDAFERFVHGPRQHVPAPRPSLSEPVGPPSDDAPLSDSTITMRVVELADLVEPIDDATDSARRRATGTRRTPPCSAGRHDARRRRGRPTPVPTRTQGTARCARAAAARLLPRERVRRATRPSRRRSGRGSARSTRRAPGAASDTRRSRGTAATACRRRRGGGPRRNSIARSARSALRW